MWSDHGCQAHLSPQCAPSWDNSLQRVNVVFGVRAGVERQALVEESSSVLDLGRIEMFHDAPAGREVDDRTVDQGVIKLAELEQDAVDPGDIVQVRASFLEELDGVVVPLAKPESAAMALGLGRLVEGVVSHGRQRLPRRAKARYLHRGSGLRLGRSRRR